MTNTLANGSMIDAKRTEIVTKSSHLNTQHVLVGDIQFGLTLTKMGQEFTGKIARPTSRHRMNRTWQSRSRSLPNRMLESLMRRTGKNVVGRAKLLQPSKPLELRRVDQFDQQSVQFHGTMDRIVENLDGRNADQPYGERFTFVSALKLEALSWDRIDDSRGDASRSLVASCFERLITGDSSSSSLSDSISLCLYVSRERTLTSGTNPD